MSKRESTQPSNGGSVTSGNGSASNGSQAAEGQKPDAVALLKADHKTVTDLFERIKKSQSADEKRELVKEVCVELIVHAKLEEEIFYPACRDRNTNSVLLDEAQVEHDGAKLLISEVIAAHPDAQYFDAKVKVLSEYIKHHINEEEKPGEGIFARAQAAGVDMNGLGARIQERKQALLQQTEAQQFYRPTLRSMKLDFISNSSSSQETSQMAQQYYSGPREQGNRSGRSGGQYMGGQQERGRAEFGRFTNENEGRGFSEQGGREQEYGQYSGQGRYGQGQSSQGYGQRDRYYGQGGEEYGRFSSGDEDEAYGSYGGEGQYGRGQHGEQYSGEYGGGYGSRGQGSFGQGSYGQGQYGEGQYGQGQYGQRQYNSPYEEYDEGRTAFGRERDEQGRFISDDERGYGQGRNFGRYDEEEDRSRGGRSQGRGQNPGQGRGWFGDSEGHSQAASQRGGYSRGPGNQDEDEGRRRSQGGGQGRGWFGDPEGHSQAASQRGGGRGSQSQSGGRGGSSSRGGERGWFGDSQGHAEAARRGWQHRQ